MTDEMYQLTFDLSRRTNQAINDLAIYYCCNRPQVLAKGLALLVIASKAKKDGGELVISNPDRTPQRIKSLYDTFNPN